MSFTLAELETAKSVAISTMKGVLLYFPYRTRSQKKK